MRKALQCILKSQLPKLVGLSESSGILGSEDTRIEEGILPFP